METRLQHDREKDCSHSCSQTASQTPRARFRLAKGAFAQRWGEHGEHRQIVFPFPGSRPNPVPGREHGTRAVASEPGLYTGEHGAGTRRRRVSCFSRARREIYPLQLDG